jgi:hypothetical protein
MPQPSGEFQGQFGTGAALFIATGVVFGAVLAWLVDTAPTRTRAIAVALKMDFMIVLPQGSFFGGISGCSRWQNYNRKSVQVQQNKSVG